VPTAVRTAVPTARRRYRRSIPAPEPDVAVPAARLPVLELPVRGAAAVVATACSHQVGSVPSAPARAAAPSASALPLASAGWVRVMISASSAVRNDMK
jgi:hypothetical protein